MIQEMLEVAGCDKYMSRRKMSQKIFQKHMEKMKKHDLLRQKKSSDALLNDDKKVEEG